MKKLLALLLALALTVSMLTVGTFATDADPNPAIVSIVPINDRQFKVAMSEEIYIGQDSFALFLAKEGVVADLTPGSSRFGGHMVPFETWATEFTWTIDGALGVTATEVISRRAEGYQVYFGMNGGLKDKGMDPTRAKDRDEYGFLPTSGLTNTTHSIHAIEVTESFKSLSVRSIKMISDERLVIEFTEPLAECSAAVLLGVRTQDGRAFYYSADTSITLDNHVVMAKEVKDGKLECWLVDAKEGMPSEDARNITKIIAAIEKEFPGHTVGIEFLEENNADINNNGVLEQVKSVNGALLGGTSNRSGRDNVVAGVSLATVGDTVCYSVAEALEKAEAGDEIKLLANVTVSDSLLVVDADVTLDLNGHTLRANNVMAFGDIIDSTDGEGKLVAAENARVILNTENTAMPLYDTDGYRFFTYTLASAGTVAQADAVKFGVQLTFTNTDAYALLAQDANAKIEMGLLVTKDEKVTDLTFTFSRATLSKYEEAWKNRTDLTKTPTMVLTVSGLNGISAITCTPGIYHDTTTVCQVGAPLTYPQVVTE